MTWKPAATAIAWKKATTKRKKKKKWASPAAWEVRWAEVQPRFRPLEPLRQLLAEAAEHRGEPLQKRQRRNARLPRKRRRRLRARRRQHAEPAVLAASGVQSAGSRVASKKADAAGAN